MFKTLKAVLTLWFKLPHPNLHVQHLQLIDFSEHICWLKEGGTFSLSLSASTFTENLTPGHPT